MKKYIIPAIIGILACILACVFACVLAGAAVYIRRKEEKDVYYPYDFE